jgi:hypothetical protein
MDGLTRFKRWTEILLNQPQRRHKFSGQITKQQARISTQKRAN